MLSAEINNAARFARLHSKQAQLKNRIKESLLKNRRILSAYNLTERDLSKHVQFLERYKPEYLYGYATILTVFAKMLDDANIKPQLSLKAVVSTSETLEKWQEDLIARVFDCPVANEYGARDAGILAYTCPSGGIHITAENCIIEVLDPVTYEPVLNGQSITDLTNYVQPRLRYMLGDMGTLSTEECCCGRRLPLVPIIEKELLQRREEQMQNQKLYRKSYDTNYLDFVFVNDMGTLFKPDYITRHFKELLQRNNLKVIRVHDLRHTCATMLCRQKISLRDIQLWLGHSTYQTTADIYTHLDYRDKLDTSSAAASMMTSIIQHNA